MSRIVFILLVMSIFSFSACSRNSSSAGSEKREAAAALAMDANSPETGKNLKPKDQLSFVFLTPSEEAKDRTLEYHVELSYTTGDFNDSRKELLQIVGQYGYIDTSSADVRDKTSKMTARVNVRVGSLYPVIQEMDKLGKLTGENITVVDHTGSLIATQRKIQREQLRIGRRSKAAGSTGASNWQAAEQSLSASEDSLDDNQQSEWAIRDASAWAKVTVIIDGPSLPEPVKVPPYQNAFVILINTVLSLFYYLIILLPILIIGGLIFWQRERLAGLFKKKK